MILTWRRSTIFNNKYLISLRPKNVPKLHKRLLFRCLHSKSKRNCRIERRQAGFCIIYRRWQAAKNGFSLRSFPHCTLIPSRIIIPNFLHTFLNFLLYISTVSKVLNKSVTIAEEILKLNFTKFKHKNGFTEPILKRT